MNTVKDPVCGMTVLQEQALSATDGDRMFYFCSDLCRRTFLTDPERYLRPLEPAGTVSSSTRPEGGNSNIRMVLTDAQRLPFADQAFDGTDSLYPLLGSQSGGRLAGTAIAS